MLLGVIVSFCTSRLRMVVAYGGQRIVVQVMAEHGEELDSKAIAAMPYAEAATKEAMRLTPIAGAVSRVALKTFELGGYTIPKARPALFSCAACL